VRLDPLLALGVALALVLLPACKDAEQPSVSSKARVMPKQGAVWGRDLAIALGLSDWELCAELGTFDCISDAHLITLGGVEPEELGIDRPLPQAAVSAPIAVDRVAIAACGERLARDEAGPAVIFGPVLDGAGEARGRRDVAKVLVQRVLARQPSETEVAALVDLYDAIEPVSEQPARDWAIGACVVVATSTEALFY
jgi:hypothetical protein